MTTTDLIAESMRRLRADLPAMIRKELRKQLKADAKKPRISKKPDHECVYSREIDQPYPRLCVKCGEPEEKPLRVTVYGRDGFRKGYIEAK